jgi:predicted DNA-binding transcriptional regulator YafY
VNRTDRLLAILLELQARGAARGEDLARHFEVSVRTIYRDLNALAQSGVPLIGTPGQGYRLMEGYFLPPLHLTASQAAVLLLGVSYVRERVDPELRTAADEAATKLSVVLPEPKRAEVEHWQRELTFLRGRGKDDPRMAQLRRAIREQRVVRMLYTAYGRTEADEREAEPISLIHLNERWHLAAYCRMRQAPRFFRLDRIDRLRVTIEQFELGPRHATRPQERSDTSGEARVRFAPALHRWVRERQIYLFRREELDATGPVFVYALRDEDVLARWLLGWGGGVVQVEPADLRARLAAEARAILARHDDATSFREAPIAPDTMLSGAAP